MPLQIRRDNIIRTFADVIVNPTDYYFSGSGGTDLEIHRAAGKELDEDLKRRDPLKTGEVCVSDAYELKNCRYIIHTVGPVYIDGKHHENEDLASCYKNALNKARELGCTSIAFPLISSGTFAFPKGEALRIATDTITSFLIDNEMNVTLLVFNKSAYDTAKKLFVDVKDYLSSFIGNDCLEAASNTERSHNGIKRRIIKQENIKCCTLTGESKLDSVLKDGDYHIGFMVGGEHPKFEPDESFSDCLRRFMKDRKLEDVDIYNKCNMDRRLFNHIKNDSKYRPKKETAVAIAIGLRLTIEETNELLSKAGYVLSGSFCFDKIIQYCIVSKTYDINDINEVLSYYDQKTLGC